MAYPEAFNELDRWRDTLRLTRDGEDVIRALEEMIGQEPDPVRLRILNLFLAEEYAAEGDDDGVEAVRRRDPGTEVHRWYDELCQTAAPADVISALEERIRSETDPDKLHALRWCLASEHRERGDYAASEAVYLGDIAARPDEPMPLISLASQKLHGENRPDEAMPIIDRAIAVAMQAGVFRRYALATKARIALELSAYDVVEEVLRQIMQLTFTRGNADIRIERDILDRLPPDSIDERVARDYAEYCRVRGKTWTTSPEYVKGLILWFSQPRWLKMARIIMQVLHECERNAIDTNGTAIANCIRALVEEGRLEAQGNLSQWRFSEVRLADVPAQSGARGDDGRGGQEPSCGEVAPMIASRALTMTVDGADIEVPIRLEAPVDKGDHWQCEFEIGWPDRHRRGRGYGLDSMQALLIAMQNIGTEIYASEVHKAGALKWERPRGGYGFPLYSGIRDRAEGDDERM